MATQDPRAIDVDDEVCWENLQEPGWDQQSREEGVDLSDPDYHE